MRVCVCVYVSWSRPKSLSQPLFGMAAALPLNGYIVLASSLTHKRERKGEMGGKEEKQESEWLEGDKEEQEEEENNGQGAGEVMLIQRRIRVELLSVKSTNYIVYLLNANLNMLFIWSLFLASPCMQFITL